MDKNINQIRDEEMRKRNMYVRLLCDSDEETKHNNL
jgi:hypothetical protein